MRSIPLGILALCSSLFKCNYLKNEKHFCKFFFHFFTLDQILNIFEKKKMIMIANVFPKLQTVKDLVKPLSSKRRFRTSFDSQHVNRWQTHLKSTSEQFYQNFWTLWMGMICKISPLLKLEILGVLVNTLTADDRYPVGHCENLQFPIQMQLS